MHKPHQPHTPSPGGKQKPCEHCEAIADALIACGIALDSDVEHHLLAIAKICRLLGQPVKDAAHILMAIDQHMDIGGRAPEQQPAAPAAPAN